MALTPMMQQYLNIKEGYKDAVLFFRLGDFYEMFFEDAVLASQVLEITLTGKNCGLEERAPMCGVPFHAADTYIGRLIDKGYKVAICEQMEDPAEAKGIVRREVTRVVTPGTIISQGMLDEKNNNYLASIYLCDAGGGLSYCDVSTGELRCAEIRGEHAHRQLIDELMRISCREILVNEDVSEALLLQEMTDRSNGLITVLPESDFTVRRGEEQIQSQFELSTLDGLGLGEKPLLIRSLGGLLSYLFATQKQTMQHLSRPLLLNLSDRMSLDKATLRNLELLENLSDKSADGTLLNILDKTQTAMGSRRLKQWIREPLNHLQDIDHRLNAVDVLTLEPLLRNDLRAGLRQIYDLERLSGRIATGHANPRDLIALQGSLNQIPDLKEELTGQRDALLSHLGQGLDALSDIATLIGGAILEDPPLTLREGGIFRKGHSEELDALKESIREGQNWIASLESVERERTGIKNLKVGYNKVFGYYLEVTRSYYDAIPDNYIRKQTLVNCERFITPELKEVESVVLNAEAKINQMEYQLFQELREKIRGEISRIQQTAQAISVLDVIVSFAEVSVRSGYTRPHVNETDEIRIEKGRHPVLESMGRNLVFVPNDLFLNRKESSMLLITGPNMSGKSTYMRQTALIVLMAQIGCFVPAQEARIGLVDRIYTRIGASDNLAQGESTFFVEMRELANILNTATGKSLVILDEIGRGTSTYDGLSVAWAAVEFLCQQERRVRSLFATHYHELTVMEERVLGVRNLNVDVQEKDGNIVFLHKIIEGSTSRSYGIHVAKLAGVPREVLETAQSKLRELEGRQRVEREFENPEQLTLFTPGEKEHPVLDRLRSIDIMHITPSEAIALLEELIDDTNE